MLELKCQPHIVLEERVIKSVVGLALGHSLYFLARDHLLKILYLLTNAEGAGEDISGLELFIGRAYFEDKKVLDVCAQPLRFITKQYYRLFPAELVNKTRFDSGELRLFFETEEGALGELFIPSKEGPLLCPLVSYSLSGKQAVSLEPLEIR